MHLHLTCHRLLKAGILCGFSLVVAACGGGGGGSGTGDGGGGGGGNQAPTAQIEFPPLNAVSIHDEITVRGTASDDGDIDSVTVNGVAADSSDGYATWIARVPLEAGENELTVTVEDDSGEKTGDAANVTVTRRDTPLLGATGIELDGDRAIVLDSTMTTVFAIDLETGERSVLSSASVGRGPMFVTGLNLDIDPANDKAYLVDYLSQSLFEIDLATGDRRILSSPSKGTGPELGVVRDVAVDVVGQRTFAIEYVSPDDFTISEIDHATGNRTIVGSAANITVPEYAAPLSVEWMPSTGELAVATYEPLIVLLDPDAGTSRNVNLDYTLVWVYDLDVHEGVAYIIDAMDWEVLSVDLATGETIPISADGRGSGDDLIDPNALAFDEAGNRLLVADISQGIVSIDNTTMERTRITSNRDLAIGSGPHFMRARTVAADPDNQQMFIVTVNDKLVAVDLEDGDRRVFNEDFSAIQEMTYDASSQRLIGMNGAEVYTADPETGELALLGIIQNPGSNLIFGMALDAPGNRIFYASQPTSISQLSLDTFMREYFSSPHVGSGEDLRSIGAMVVDRTHHRLLVSDRSPGEIKAIDLTTGDRTDLVSDGELTGINLYGASAFHVGENGNGIIALDGTAGQIVEIIPGVPDGKVLAGAEHPLGASVGLVVDEAHGIAWTVTGTSVVAVDLVGGDHVIISH